jgi:hypothetical protein
VTEVQTTVDGNSGLAHTGHGHQFNGPTYFVADGERLLRSGPAPRFTARDHLARLNRQFVEPSGYAKAQELLADSGCVILTGKPGIGVRATGQVLLRRLGGPAAVIRDESGLPERPEDPILATADVTEGDLILLDPAEAEDKALARVMEKLPSYQAEVRKRGAHLVVVLAGDRRDLVRMELRPLIAPVLRPSGLAVVRRHLDVAGIPCTEEQLTSNTHLRARVNVDPIRELAELVLRIAEARERLGKAAGFDAWLNDALDLLGELGGQVTAKVKEYRTGPQRALLLATAMLETAPGDQVHLAAATLVAATAQPDDERPALERDDLAQRLSELDIIVDVAGHVRFPTFRYADAVRKHFWNNFPELRTTFQRWASRVGVSAEMDASYRGEFVAHFVDQALRTNRPDDVAALVDTWTEPRADQSRSLPSAATALELGLSHPRHGARFRRLIYSWSRDPHLAKSTAYLGITLSGDVIAATHPAEALVRLHHFVRNQTDDVRAAAQEALLRLVRQDRREFRRLAERVATGQGHRRSADFDLFLVIARPDELLPSRGRALILDDFVRDQLVLGWRAMLFERDRPFWTELAREWLTAAESGGLFEDRWLGVFTEACATPGAGSARLYAAAREWMREPGSDHAGRHRIALDLTNRMNRAQGIALAPGPRHRSEEPVR